MGNENGPNDEVGPVDVQALAVQMLKGNSGDTSPDVSTESEPDNSTEEEIYSDSEEEGSSKKLGGHPAWQEILSAVPEELHEALTPKLKEWDAGVTRRFQEIHSQYEPLKSFEPLIEEGFDPDSLSQAIGLYQALNADPEQVYQALGQAYGFASEQESADDYDEDSEYNVPPQLLEQLQRQERAIEAMAEQLQQQQMSEQELEQQAALDEYVNLLHESYGEFDEDYVFTKMAAGVDGEVAVRQYQELVPPQVQQTRTPAPKVLGSSGVGSGGIPTSSPEVTRLSEQDTRRLVEETLRASASTN